MVFHSQESIHVYLKKLFRENEVVVIENLEKLNRIGDQLFTFCALPLKHVDADGSPVRAIAMLED